MSNFQLWRARLASVLRCKFHLCALLTTMLCLVAVSGNAQTPPPLRRGTPATRPQPTPQRATPTPTPLPVQVPQTPNTTGRARFDVTNYKIDAELQPAQHLLRAQADVTFTPLDE